MKRIYFSLLILVPMLLLSGCYAFVSPGTGHLDITIELPLGAKGPGERQMAIFVATAGEQMTKDIAHLLWLVDKDKDEGLDDDEEDTLEDLALNISRNGLVKYDGDIFKRILISDASNAGSFRLPLPVIEEGYLIKLFVVDAAEDLDALTLDELQEVDLDDDIAENKIFDTEDYSTDWRLWNLNTPTFPIRAEAGEVTRVTLVLGPEE